MGLLTGLVGASTGVGIIIYTRALRKVALFSSAPPRPAQPALHLCAASRA